LESGKLSGYLRYTENVNVLLCAATELECALLHSHVRTCVTGVGQVNVAHMLTLEIERKRPDAILNVGIGGAYPQSGLDLCDVACADSETFGDLGVATADGFVELTEFVKNRFALQLFPVATRVPFVTVSTCSGTDQLSYALAERTHGAVENMEGAAVAQIAARYGIPMGELRAISNFTGRRDRAAWKVREAAEAAQQAALAWLHSLRAKIE
jgi:futalosine hydrolase